MRAEDLAGCMERYLAAFRARQAFTLEYRLRRHDGEYRWILDYGQPFTLLNGAFGGYIGYCYDFTERRQAEEQLQRFNAELEGKITQRTADLAARNREVQALLESIPDLVLRLHRDGRMLACQPAKEATPLAGQQLEQSAPLRAAALAVGARALAGNATVAAETVLNREDGSLTLELRAAPLGTDEFVVFVRDITSRKRLEAETAAMLEKEREVSEMKSRFISVTSHKFRPPMTAALGSAELLHAHLDRLTPAKREYLFKRIFDSMGSMTDMLSLNRADAKRVTVRPAALDLPQLVKSVVEEVRLGDRDAHRFEFETTGAPGEFVSDPNLLRHILSNLLGNAARYSPAGTAITTRIEAASAQVRIVVADQGIGIIPADRERIFEPFERGSNAGTTQGTGLGLNIVKRITDLLGGTIGIEDVAGGGTRFIVTLPRQPAPAAPPDERAGNESPAASDRHLGN